MNNSYDLDIYDPIKEDLETVTRPFTLSPELWSKFTISDLSDVDFTQWRSVKLLENGDFSTQLSMIPAEYGGIYVYCIEPHIIPAAGSYIMYIGKATKTATENLKNRVRSYRSCLTDRETRPRLHKLFEKWGEYVYVHYLPVAGSKEEITALEDRLIAAFGKPPCNSEIRIKSVKTAVKAFN